MFFRKKTLLQLKCKPIIYGKLENCTVDSYVRSEKTLRHVPHPGMHPNIQTPGKVLYRNTSLSLVLIFVKMVYSMAIVKITT
jgi:hypothetical protein